MIYTICYVLCIGYLIHWFWNVLFGSEYKNMLTDEEIQKERDAKQKEYDDYWKQEEEKKKARAQRKKLKLKKTK